MTARSASITASCGTCRRYSTCSARQRPHSSSSRGTCPSIRRRSMHWRRPGMRSGVTECATKSGVSSPPTKSSTTSDAASTISLIMASNCSGSARRAGSPRRAPPRSCPRPGCATCLRSRSPPACSTAAWRSWSAIRRRRMLRSTHPGSRNSASTSRDPRRCPRRISYTGSWPRSRRRSPRAAAWRSSVIRTCSHRHRSAPMQLASRRSARS